MKQLKQAMLTKFNELVDGNNIPFETNKEAAEKDVLYNLYLDSFNPEDNKLFRERRKYDCSACRNFIRNIGGVVFIKENQKISIWDIDMSGTVFEPVVKTLAAFVKARPIQTIYLNDSKQVGIDCNHEEMDDGHIHTWEHLHLQLLSYMVLDTRYESIESKQGNANAIAQVLGRSLTEISVDSLETVIELIRQNSLYKGEEWLAVLKEFLKLKKEFDALPEDEKENYIWAKSVTVGPVLGKIRNHSIGVLLTDITNNVDLTKAVSSYEKIVAPSNYKRPKPIISQRMIKEAQKKINELGLESALQRRFATAADIDINDIAFVDRDVQSTLKNGNIFDDLLSTVSAKPKSFDKIQEVSIEKFMADILPTLTGLDALVETRHQKNLASLIAPVNDEVGQLFKWNNNFTWAYNGNMTDSSIRDNVKSHGGNVEGVLRFSLQWNDGNTHEKDDLDAHCIESLDHMTRQNEIYFGEKRSRYTGGALDVDIQNPNAGKPAVENIVWSTKQDLKSGKYEFFVKNFARRSGTNGFSAELEVDGTVYQLHYPKSLRNKEKIKVASVKYDEQTGEFQTHIFIENEQQSQDVWGITTNQFVPVSLVTLSPNYWGDEKGVGNKHYMFILDRCINGDNPNGFYNEYLIQELAEHRKVFEALGEQLKVPSTTEQLSGLGFSSTQSNELIVKAKGATERMLKIKF